MDASLPLTDAAPRTADALEEVRALYLEHAEGLASALRRLTWPGCDYEDLMQEIFVIAIRRQRQLLLATSQKAWLYGVALKVAATARRSHRVRSLFGLARIAPTEPTEQLEAVQSVHRALAGLAPKKREVLVLFELEGLTGPEIAQALGCPLKTVWTRLHHARKEFERAVKRHG
jgi:RNA polymerase sigma-70 factor (ECF subfamily)